MFPFIIVVWSWLQPFVASLTEGRGLARRPAHLLNKRLLLAPTHVDHYTSAASPLTSVDVNPTSPRFCRVSAILWYIFNATISQKIENFKDGEYTNWDF